MIFRTLLAVGLAAVLTGCVTSGASDPTALTSLPQELEQFRADDGLLMVPQLVDRGPELTTSVFALQLERLVAGTARSAAPASAQLRELRGTRSRGGAVRHAWYLAQLESALDVRAVDRALVDEVVRAQQPSGWFAAVRDDGRAPTALPALIDDSSKALLVLSGRDAPGDWRSRLRSAAEAAVTAELPAFSRWQLAGVLRDTGSEKRPASASEVPPAPPTRLDDEEAAAHRLAGHLQLGGVLPPDLVRAWVAWLEQPRPVGLVALVAEPLLEVAGPVEADRLRAAAAARIAPLRLQSGLFAADGQVVGDLRATWLFQTLSKTTGRPFTDPALAAALGGYASRDTDERAQWTAALRDRATSLATGVPGGSDAGGLPWLGRPGADGARQLPELAVMAVDLGADVPRPVVPDLSTLPPGPAAHAAVAGWVAHGAFPAVAPGTLSAWKDLVRSSAATSYREYFHAATAVLLAEGVQENSTWIVDDAARRTTADGACRGVAFLVPERAGSRSCDLQASLAAYLFSLAARSGEVVAEVRS